MTNGAKSMGWDELNRMLSFNPGPGGQATLYVYRADGMRVRKGQLASPNVYTEYAYDGQMPVEEYNYRSVYPISFIKVIRYGLGARGVDYIEKVPANGSLIVGYPIYDDHGNMIATLGKNGVLADQRSYDAWGVIRSGNTTGEPHGQYCANLGHLADDESGLIYMRARYYEPGCGRFVSEDPAAQGRNWFTYCKGDPINLTDPSGLMIEELLTDLCIEQTADAESAGEFLNVLAQSSSKLQELMDVSNEVLSLMIQDDGISNSKVLEAIAKLGRDPKKWRKAYLLFEHASGETIKIHSFAEMVDGVVTAIAKGGNNPWWEWL